MAATRHGCQINGLPYLSKLPHQQPVGFGSDVRTTRLGGGGGGATTLLYYYYSSIASYLLRYGTTRRSLLPLGYAPLVVCTPSRDTLGGSGTVTPPSGLPLL